MKSVLIIAEAGVNHNGDINNAYKLCDAAKEAGVDIIKFQTFKTENIVTQNTKLADYQKENININETQYEMIKKLELSFSDFKEIKAYCDNIGLKFLSTPDDEESLDFLVNELKMDIIKIGSGEVTNIPYLKQIGLKKLPVILSTGMSTLSETARAYEILMENGAKSISLLHCTTNYPCPFNEVNLNAMITLKNSFKTMTGYSDHTLGIEVPIAAVALGAEIIEKHFTIDKNLPGPDHIASLNPVELKKMVDSIRNIEKSLGNGIKKPNESELKIKSVIQRSIVAKKDIQMGEKLTEDNLTTKRADNRGLSSNLWDYVIGLNAVDNFKVDDTIYLK